MKVAMVAACPFPANHGTPGAIRELALHLSTLGHEVHVVTYPSGESLPIEGLHVHRAHVPLYMPGPIRIGPSFERLLFDVCLVPKLIAVVRRYGIEVIHAHNYEANIAGWIARLLTRRPLIYHGVTALADELPSYERIRPKAAARVAGKLLDRVVPMLSDLRLVLSDELRDYLVRLGNRPERVLIVPPGVEKDWLTSGDGVRARARIGVAADTPLVMYTGALETFQRIDYLLQAAALVFADIPHAVLVIAGNIDNPRARAQCDRWAAELGITERLRFVESVALQDLPDFLAAANVTTLPRPFCPGYPIKLLNYMGAGRPTVVFAGNAKSIYHGYNGYVARNDDVVDFAAGIRLFLEDPKLATIIGSRARASLAGAFDWDTIARGVALVYRQLTVDPKGLSAIALADYFKRSYRPRLDRRQHVTPFLLSGRLDYPSWREGGIRGLRESSRPGPTLTESPYGVVAEHTPLGARAADSDRGRKG